MKLFISLHYLVQFQFLCVVWIGFLNSVNGFQENRFIFNFSVVKEKETSGSSTKRYEIDLTLYFGLKKRTTELFFTVFSPARDLKVLSFVKDVKRVDTAVKPPATPKPATCDHKKDYDDMLLSLTDENLEKFGVVRKPFNIPDATIDIPVGYNFFEIPLAPLVPSNFTIEDGIYSMKLIASFDKGGIDSKYIWIIAFSEKDGGSPSEKQSCLVHDVEIGKKFFNIISKKKYWMYYCHSTTNASLLNISPELRKPVTAFITGTRLFYGSTEATYTITILASAVGTSLKTNQVKIYIQIPVDLCYGNSCFTVNKENPCLNLKRILFEKCEYASDIYQFILWSDKDQNVGTAVIVIEHFNHPVVNLNINKKWIVNVYTLDKVFAILSDEHIKLLEPVAKGTCKKRLYDFLKGQKDTIPWTNSHIGYFNTPEMKHMNLKLLPLDDVADNPVILSFQIENLEDKIYPNCMIQLKGIHLFISSSTSSKQRINEHNLKLFLPSPIYKTTEESTKIINLEKVEVQNNDILTFIMEIIKYNDNEYWFGALTCKDLKKNYIKEAESFFSYPIKNTKIFISDLYLFNSKPVNKKYIFYLHILVTMEKEIKVHVTIPPDNKNLSLPTPCNLAISTCCYNLVYHGCVSEENKMKYRINSFKSSDKFFTIQFPLTVANEDTKSKIEIDVMSVLDKERKIKKKLEIDMNHIKKHQVRSPCVNNVKLRLKKSKKYSSHLFLLFKVVNCYKPYEPYLMSAYNAEIFHVESDKNEKYEKYTFQKMYKQTFPSNNFSISQKLFEKGVLIVNTMILIDNDFVDLLAEKEYTELIKFFTDSITLPYHKFFVTTFINNSIRVEMYKYQSLGNIQRTTVMKSLQVTDLNKALEKTVKFLRTTVSTKIPKYIHSEFSILVLTDANGIESIKSNSKDYEYKLIEDLDKSIVRIYAVQIEKGIEERYEPFKDSLQNVSYIQVYGTDARSDILFVSFHKYIVDKPMILTYTKAIVDDYLTLETVLNKTSWILIGVCRHNIIEKSPVKRTIHLYHLQKKLKSISYSITPEEAFKAYDNLSPASFHDPCNIFTQLQILGM